MTEVFKDATSFYSGSVNYYYDGTVGHTINDICLRDNQSGYIPVLSDMNSRVKDIIEYTADSVSEAECKAGSIYVEPKARITRDLLRSSGYTITRDPEKASVIIVPSISKERLYSLYANIVIYKESTQELFLFRRKSNFEVTEEEITAIKNKIESILGEPDCPLQFFYDESLSKMSVTWIPPIESYYHMILKDKNNKKYTLDCTVPTMPLYNISIDTLEIWSHIDDRTLMDKCLIGSDWRKYPFTVYTFFSSMSHHCNIYIGSSQNRNVKMILDTIGYYNGEYDSDKFISPEDWNMCQRWIMHVLGVDEEKGGYVQYEDISALSYYYDVALRRRAAVAPMFINAEMQYDDLKNMI